MSPIEKEENKVFVGNLAYSTDKDALRTYFESAGKVTQATVIRRSKHRSAGYGFVTFETSQEAHQAAETLNKTELDEREISVQIARPKGDTRPPTIASTTRLFVANLPYKTTEDELAELFHGFDIDTVSIARLKSGRSKGYGFVDVQDENTQLKIIQHFEPVTLHDRVVSVKVAKVALDPQDLDAAANQVKQDEE